MAYQGKHGLGWIGLGALALLGWSGCSPDPEELERRFQPVYQVCAQAVNEGKWDAAREACPRALEVDPESTDALVAMGLVHYNRQELDTAEEFYRKALAIDPNNAPAHTNLGTLLSEQKRHAEAIEHFKTALAEPNSNTFILHLNYGRACYETGDWVGAEEQYDKALREAPNACIANLRQGEVQERLKRFDTATQRYRNCIKNCPDLAACHFRLGEALLQTSKTQEAVAEFTHVCKKLPDSPEATDACRYLKLYRSGAK